MTVVVADTSALVSLGTVADREPDPFTVLLDRYEVAVPERVVAELDETAAYDDASGTAAAAVLDRADRLAVEPAELDADFPLDDGENAAVSLANDRDAAMLLCDEFNRIGLVHASLADVHLVTTPKLLAVFVRKGLLEGESACRLLDGMSERRSWETNSYVRRARESLS